MILTTGIPHFGVGMIHVGAHFRLPFRYGLSHRRQMIFECLAGTVTLRRRTIFGYRQEIRALVDVRSAEVETTPVALGLASDTGPQQQAERINDCLATA